MDWVQKLCNALLAPGGSVTTIDVVRIRDGQFLILVGENHAYDWGPRSTPAKRIRDLIGYALASGKMRVFVEGQSTLQGPAMTPDPRFTSYTSQLLRDWAGNHHPNVRSIDIRDHTIMQQLVVGRNQLKPGALARMATSILYIYRGRLSIKQVHTLHQCVAAWDNKKLPDDWDLLCAEVHSGEASSRIQHTAELLLEMEETALVLRRTLNNLMDLEALKHMLQQVQSAGVVMFYGGATHTWGMLEILFGQADASQDLEYDFVPEMMLQHRRKGHL